MDLQELALSYPCQYCGAPVDRWCTTMPSRQLAGYLHETRMYAIRQAFGAGFNEGWDGGFNAAQRVRS